MQKRISHRKSRKGCGNCKQRHVKCDEKGPPCAACEIRATTSTCSYSNNNSPTPPRQDNAVSSGSDLAKATASPQLTRAVSASSQSRRLLELRLMHRWSTTTYLSFCCTAYDPPWLQFHVPDCALEHDFLLYGIFAISSLDMVIGGALLDEGHVAMHFQAALEYYDKASESFRQQLSNVTPNNFHSVYMFAFLAAAMYMARPLCPREQQNQQAEGVIGRAAVVMKLLMACSSLAEKNAALMLDSNSISGSSLATVISAIGDVCGSQDPLDTNTEAALARLSLLVETNACMSLGTVGSPLRNNSYQNAVKWLRVSFGMETKYGDTVVGFCLAWPALAGKEFVDAFGKADTMALLIVMHWAVLLDRLGVIAWWAGSMGRDLVRDISAALLQSMPQDLVVPDIYLSIKWARERVSIGAELGLSYSI